MSMRRIFCGKTRSMARRLALGMGIALLAACQAAAPVQTPAPAAASAGQATSGAVQVVRINAKRFEYTPNVIRVKRGVPVLLELTADDHDHGFWLRAFRVQADLDQGKTVRVKFIPDKVGTFEFHCDNYCGDFHEDMTGTLIVTE